MNHHASHKHDTTGSFAIRTNETKAPLPFWNFFKNSGKNGAGVGRLQRNDTSSFACIMPGRNSQENIKGNLGLFGNVAPRIPQQLTNEKLKYYKEFLKTEKTFPTTQPEFHDYSSNQTEMFVRNTLYLNKDEMNQWRQHEIPIKEAERRLKTFKVFPQEDIVDNPVSTRSFAQSPFELKAVPKPRKRRGTKTTETLFGDIVEEI